jgi:secernin
MADRSTPQNRPWSCDTFAVHAAHTAYRATILGKNSDRPAGETQPLRWVGSRRGGGRVRLAYVEVDEVAETIPHLGSSPYWCWGHESGVNVHGVAIGNEALFTRDLAEAVSDARSGSHVKAGVLGMELVRLGLERAGSASAAVEVMTGLLERHGQWGAGTAGAEPADAAYDNSYLVADPREVWVLETSGRGWVTRRVDTAWAALSNEPTVRADWTGCSEGLWRHAEDRGWAASSEVDGDRNGGDFADTFADPLTPLQVSHLRLQRARQMLTDAVATGALGFHQVRRILSDHYEDTFLAGPTFNPARPDFHTLCMHDHPAGFTWGNTAASTIAVLSGDGPPVTWWAATTPCTSVYVPVAVLGYPLPAELESAGSRHDAGPNPQRVEPDTHAPDSYWWAFQALLDAVVGDSRGTAYQKRQPVVRARFDALQESWLGAVAQMPADAPARHWHELTGRCVREALTAARELLADFGGPGGRARGAEERVSAPR